MKLIYQWLIILVLAGILWALHIYGGAGCSKPFPTPPYIPPLKIMVKNRSLDTNASTSQDEVPTVPSTPPSKSHSQKRRERRKKRLTIKVTQDDTEWDLCEDKDFRGVKDERMIQ